MLDHHQTATCPHCNKDSYAAETEAWFSTAKCTWCGCEFKRDSSSGEYVIIKEGECKE